jgi:hypothetical protein
MSRLSILSLLGAAALTAALPSDLSARAVTFAAGSTWDIILRGSGDAKNVDAIVKASFSTIDIDLFDTTADDIKKMKANKKVICYFSAGSREDWRPDAGDFDPADYRNPVEGGPDGNWEGENWVDVTSTNVTNIMKKRIELAKSKGCDAVDPDNVDGFVSPLGDDCQLIR